MAACQAAADHHRWLASYLRVPQLLDAGDRWLDFEHIDGHPPQPADLPGLAGHLGTVHGTMFGRALHNARLETPYDTGDSTRIADFLGPRRTAVADRLTRDRVPYPAYTMPEADRILTSAADLPAVIYKDTNIRNVLLTGDGPIHLDFDDLTLAPPGYDLAKLLLSAAMTHGPQATIIFDAALRQYDAALASTGVAPCGPDRLAGWLEIHHILTPHTSAATATGTPGINCAREPATASEPHLATDARRTQDRRVNRRSNIINVEC